MEVESYLPSSHGGGVLPGNQRGLSGSAATAETATDLDPAGATCLLTLNLFPPRKEAFVAPTIDPFFWELQIHDSNKESLMHFKKIFLHFILNISDH